MRFALTTALLVTVAPAAGPQQLTAAPTSQEKGLILARDEGDRRVRRSRPVGTGAASAGSLIIKVDQSNGGSSDLFMAFEVLQPGGAIPIHRHRMYDEILFIHRGAGIATLGSRQAAVTEGATIYVSPGTRVGLHNTGKIPLELVFLFPKPASVSSYYDELTVKEGQPVIPFTLEGFEAFRSRHRSHIEFE